MPFARFVVMSRNELTFPFKRYNQNVWRGDRPSGRYRSSAVRLRHHWLESTLCELELVQIFSEGLSALGIA